MSSLLNDEHFPTGQSNTCISIYEKKEVNSHSKSNQYYSLITNVLLKLHLIQGTQIIIFELRSKLLLHPYLETHKGTKHETIFFEEVNSREVGLNS